MYGNTQFGDETEDVTLTPEQRDALRRDLTTVAARTREVLPAEFTIGSEIAESGSGPQATIAVQPPVGSPVSAAYTPDDDEISISDDEVDDLVHGLAASAALQVKEAMGENDRPVAQ